MDIIELQEPSLSSLLGIIENKMGAYGCLFRGHGDAGWGLCPSLYRIPNLRVHGQSLEKNYDYFEQKCLDFFFTEGLPYLPHIPRGYVNDRILGQHFGVPTKLLDWSTDPFVATFFAVEDFNRDSDAAIFILLPDANYSVDQVGPIDDQHPHRAMAFRPPAIDRRIPAQKSVFTLHPFGPPNEKYVPIDLRQEIGGQHSVRGGIVKRGFAKITIPKGFKLLLLQTLLSLGIDRRNLFPGLDGVGTDVALRVKVDQIR